MAAYDANGNMTSQTTIASGDVVDYVYDNHNRLIEVTNYTNVADVLVESQDVAYSYDALGNLIGRSLTPYSGGVAGTTTTARFVFDGDQMVLAFDGSSNLTDRFLNGSAVDQILADEHYSSPTASPTSAGAVDWYLADNQGTVRDIIDSGDTLEDHLSYNSFGALTGQSGAATFPATDLIVGEYTGSFYDSATGLVHDGDRWYDPATERWIGEDPTGLTADSNPYRYVRNAPVNAVDPSGDVLLPQIIFRRGLNTIQAINGGGDLRLARVFRSVLPYASGITATAVAQFEGSPGVGLSKSALVSTSIGASWSATQARNGVITAHVDAEAALGVWDVELGGLGDAGLVERVETNPVQDFIAGGVFAFAFDNSGLYQVWANVTMSVTASGNMITVIGSTTSNGSSPDRFGSPAPFPGTFSR